MKKKIPCPTCNKPDTWHKNNSYRPFCSERCKLIDLGAWADERYRIPTDDQPPVSENEPNNKD